MGAGYGPIVVAREPLALDDLADLEIAVPGRMTTAFLVLRMAIGRLPLPGGAVRPDPRRGEVGRADVGLVIHEGQLTYADEGLEKVLDLGEWWLLETGLPLPLGANVARRDLGDEQLAVLSAVLQDSIRTVSTTAPRRWRTRWSSAAASSRISPTGSSACT